MEMSILGWLSNKSAEADAVSIDYLTRGGQAKIKGSQRVILNSAIKRKKKIKLAILEVIHRKTN